MTKKNKNNTEELLTDESIKKAIGNKSSWYSLADGERLYLHVYPDGRKVWKYRYRHNNNSSSIEFGSYPKVCLSKARDETKVADYILEGGIDPKTYGFWNKKKAEIVIKDKKRPKDQGFYLNVIMTLVIMLLSIQVALLIPGALEKERSFDQIRLDKFILQEKMKNTFFNTKE